MENKAQMIVGIIFCGLAYGIFDFYDYWTNEYPSLQAQEQQMSAKIAGLETESQKLQSFAKNINVIKQEFRELNMQLEAVLEHMPRTFNLASLLRKLTMLAQNSGVEILVFKPSRSAVRQEPAKTGDPTTFYETITVEFTVKGAFTQTLVFFDQLARLKRIINVDSLKMSILRETHDIQKGAPIVAASDVVIRTYRFTE